MNVFSIRQILDFNARYEEKEIENTFTVIIVFAIQDTTNDDHHSVSYLVRRYVDRGVSPIPILVKSQVGQKLPKKRRRTTYTYKHRERIDYTNYTMTKERVFFSSFVELLVHVNEQFDTKRYEKRNVMCVW